MLNNFRAHTGQGEDPGKINPGEASSVSGGHHVIDHWELDNDCLGRLPSCHNVCATFFLLQADITSTTAPHSERRVDSATIHLEWHDFFQAVLDADAQRQASTRWARLYIAQ